MRVLRPVFHLGTTTAIFIWCALAPACAPGSHLIYVKRSVAVPSPAATAPVRAEVRDRLYLLKTHTPAARMENDRAIASALNGKWPTASQTWSNLLTSTGDCYVASNLALSRYVKGAHADAFDTMRLALKACPEDAKIRWNFRALSRPSRAPRVEYELEP